MCDCTTKKLYYIAKNTIMILMIILGNIILFSYKPLELDTFDDEIGLVEILDFTYNKR